MEGIIVDIGMGKVLVCGFGWGIEWADIVLQSWEEKDKGLLEGWSEENAREWGSKIFVVSVLGRNEYIDGWVNVVVGLVWIVGLCRVFFM